MPFSQSGTTVKVKVTPANTISVGATNIIPFSTTSPVKTVKSQFNAIDTISELSDVTGSPQDGATLVYDSALGKYVIQQLTAQDINISSLDGGTF